MLTSIAQSASSGGSDVALLFPLLLSLGLAFIPANIAKKKGYSAGGFYVFGVLFFLIAVIVVLCLRDKTKTSPTAVPTYPATVNSAMPPPPRPSGSTDPWAAGRTD